MKSVSPQVDPASVRTAFHLALSLERKNFLPLLPESLHCSVAFLLQNNEAVCLQTHTTPLFPWESFPLFLFVLLTSLMLCVVRTSLTDLQKVWYGLFNQKAAAGGLFKSYSCKYPGETTAGSAFLGLELATCRLQESVANHYCRSRVRPAGTRHSPHAGKQLLYLPPTTTPPLCSTSLTISIASLLADKFIPSPWFIALILTPQDAPSVSKHT